MTGVALPRFQSGGALREDAFYVERPADTELPETILRGEFCYVLAPRQVGKSSLRARAGRRLREAGVHCVSLDLSRIGTAGVSADEWYYALIEEVAIALELADDPADFWKRREHLPPVNRWSRYLHDEVLARIDGPVAIFVDEIDTVQELDFSGDDFFGAIRAVYNARAQDPIYNRLTFCLIGVAAPGDLVQDPRLAPFNIGRWIRLDDFTRAEAAALLPGLSGLGADPQALLDAVFEWTDGHPFMTQRICEVLAQQGSDGKAPAAERVAAIVHEVFLSGGRAEVPLFADAERRLAPPPDAGQLHESSGQLLQLYRHLVTRGRMPADPGSPNHLALRLTGVAAERRDDAGHWLQSRNRIFATIFDENWVREKESGRFLSEPVARWIAKGRHDAYVFREQQLEEARVWAEGRHDVTSEERDFLLAGLEVARREADERQQALRQRERLEERARAQRRVIRIVLAAALLCLLAAVLAGWQYVNADRAKGRAERAELLARAAAERAKSAQAMAEAARQQALVSAQNARRSAREESVAKQLAQKAATNEARAAVAKERERAQAQEAARRAEAAREQAEAANARATQANLLERGTRALLLAQSQDPQKQIEALRLATAAAEESRQNPPPEVVEGLTAALTAVRGSQFLGKPSVLFKSAFVSPDGERVLTVSVNGKAQLWDALTGNPIAAFRGSAPRAQGATFSENGARLLTTGDMDGVQLWNARAGRALTRFPSRAPASAVISPDGKRVIIASGDGTVGIWEAKTGKQLVTFKVPPGGVKSVVCSSDGKRVLIVTADGRADFWGSDTGPLRPLQESPSGVESGAFSPDGKRLLTWANRQVSEPGVPGLAPTGSTTWVSAIRMWEGDTGDPILTLEGQFGKIDCAAFSPNGSIVTTGADHVARVWNDQGQLLYTLLGHSKEVTSAAFSLPYGQQIVTTSTDGTARVWEAGSGKLVATLPGHEAEVYRAALSSDGTRAVTASKDGTVRLWNLYPDLSLNSFGEDPPIRLVAFSRDGARIITKSDRGRVDVWDVSRHPAQPLDPRNQDRSAAFAPGGSREVALQKDGTARSPDGTRVFSVSGNGTVELWDRRARKRIATLWGETRDTRAARFVAFSPDGRRVVTRGDEKVAQLWNFTTVKRYMLTGHQDTVTSAVFSPNGKLVLTASVDGTARLWDAATGKTLVTYQGFTEVVNAAAFSRDSTQIVTASADGTVKIFPTTVPAFLKMAREALVASPRASARIRQ
jgi:WD40 repeat protein